MNNLKDFWAAYAAVQRLKKEAQDRSSAENAFESIQSFLRKYFAQNFPKDQLEIFYSDEKDLKDLLANLKKYPELAQDNWHDLDYLLTCLKLGNYETRNISNLPTLEDFKS